MKKNDIYPKTIFMYSLPFLMFSLLSFSVFLYYKKQIINDHIEFLEAQVPGLKSENIMLMKEVDKLSKYRASAKYDLEKFQPIINKLLIDQPQHSIQEMQEVNSYLINNLATPDFLSNDNFDLLSSNNLEKLANYRLIKFKNDVINYLVSHYFGSYSDMIIHNHFNILDYWSKEEYKINLHYIPDDTYQTKMKINGLQRNEDAILFGPKKAGLHTIDISLSQFDSDGKEKKLNFKKDIFVLP